MAGHATPDRQSAGQQGGPTRGTNIGTDVEAGELNPLLRHAIEMGRLDVGMAEAAEVAIPEVVRKDENYVRLVLGIYCESAAEKE